MRLLTVFIVAGGVLWLAIKVAIMWREKQ